MLKFGIHEPLGDFLSSCGWLFDTVWAVSAVTLFIASTLVVLLYRWRSLEVRLISSCRENTLRAAPPQSSIR
jgi:hypothetical protein